MLVPNNLTSSGSHPAWKKYLYCILPKELNTLFCSFQTIVQMYGNYSSCLFLKNHITLKVEDCCPWWS